MQVRDDHERRAVRREPSREDLVETCFLEDGLGDEGERSERREGGDLLIFFWGGGGGGRGREKRERGGEREEQRTKAKKPNQPAPKQLKFESRFELKHTCA